MNNQLQTWREHAAEGTITLEEMTEAITLLRNGRVSACFAVKVKMEKKPIPSCEELLVLLKEYINENNTQ